MARLNEAPAANDDLDNLRRKFLRQNKDIARENSAKSLRIRALENEVARLLSENLGLSESIVHLESELSASKNRRIINHITSTRSKLEVKLEEIAALVAGISHVPSCKGRASQYDRQSCEGTTDSGQRRWKEGITVEREIREGMLPPILEDYQYPRKTLDQAEIESMIQANTSTDLNGSPDIGSPPVSSFANEDPVKIELLGQRTSNSNNPATQPELIVGAESVLSVNLEQRRRRKENISMEEPARTQETVQEKVEAVPQPLKTGAKRKLNVREDDDIKLLYHSDDVDTSREQTVVPDDRADLVVALDVARIAIVHDPAPTCSLAHSSKNEIHKKTASRKALSSKAATDLVQSPKKRTREAAYDEVAAAKADLSGVIQNHERKSSRIRGSIPVSVSTGSAPLPAPVAFELGTINKSGSKAASQVGLETPAFKSLSSSVCIPTVKAFSRDTPPPAEHGHEAEANRPSRRARAAVSYAEPNLRDKMRRPTKELVAAVCEDRARQIIDLENATNTMAPTPSTAIKTEPFDDRATWADARSAEHAKYTCSPLSNKVSSLAISGIADVKPSHKALQGKSNTTLAKETVVKSAVSGTIGQKDIELTPLSTEAALPNTLQDDADVSPSREEPLGLKGSCVAQRISQSGNRIETLNTENRIKLVPQSRRRRSTFDLGSTQRTSIQCKAVIPGNELKKVNSTSSTSESTNSRRESLNISAPISRDKISLESPRTERATRRRSMML